MLSWRLVRCGPVLHVMLWCACVPSGCPQCVPWVLCWHTSLCVYGDAKAKFESEDVVDLREALSGQRIRVYPCPVTWSVHVVKNGLVEHGGVGVEVVVLLVVYMS